MNICVNGKKSLIKSFVVVDGEFGWCWRLYVYNKSKNLSQLKCECVELGAKN